MRSRAVARGTRARRWRRRRRRRDGGFDSFVRWREVDAREGRRDDEEGRERREGGVREA